MLGSKWSTHGGVWHAGRWGREHVRYNTQCCVRDHSDTLTEDACTGRSWKGAVSSRYVEKEHHRSIGQSEDMLVYSSVGVVLVQAWFTEPLGVVTSLPVLFDTFTQNVAVVWWVWSGGATVSYGTVSRLESDRLFSSGWEYEVRCCYKVMK